MAKVATKSQREAAIRACGRYHGSQQPGYGVDVKTATRLHRAMMTHLEKINPDHHDKLMELARNWWNEKLMKGAWVDW